MESFGSDNSPESRARRRRAYENWQIPEEDKPILELVRPKPHTFTFPLVREVVSNVVEFPVDRTRPADPPDIAA